MSANRSGVKSSMIKFENVTKLYQRGARPALDSVSFTVERGEFVFLVGESGSGKSTMLSLIMAQERPTSGHVHILGKDLATLSAPRLPLLRRQMGTVFQDFRLLPEKNVFENVALAMQVLGRPRSQINKDVPEILNLVGLDGKEKRRMYELSGGEQQRVAIARAMVNRPELLLADEPTGNLDPRNTDEIMQLIDRINRSGTTVVMATHDQRMVNMSRRRVVELANGVIIRDQEHGVYGGGQA